MPGSVRSGTTGGVLMTATLVADVLSLSSAAEPNCRRARLTRPAYAFAADADGTCRWLGCAPCAVRS